MISSQLFDSTVNYFLWCCLVIFAFSKLLTINNVLTSWKKITTTIKQLTGSYQKNNWLTKKIEYVIYGWPFLCHQLLSFRNWSLTIILEKYIVDLKSHLKYLSTQKWSQPKITSVWSWVNLSKKDPMYKKRWTVWSKQYFF